MQKQDSIDAISSLANADNDLIAVDDAHRELLGFAKQLTVAPAETCDDDVQRLRSVGWNDQQIAEAVYVVSLFAMFNRVADAFGLIAEDFR